MTVKHTRRGPQSTSGDAAEDGATTQAPHDLGPHTALRDPLSNQEDGSVGGGEAKLKAGLRARDLLDRSDTPTKDPTTPSGPARAGLPDDLPPVRLPSLFKPAQFAKASQSRGARPRALKAIDAHLEAIDGAVDPAEGFQHLEALQETLADFVLRYGTKNTDRLKVAKALKRWVDGAVTLRSPHFHPIPSEPDPKT